MFKVSLFLLIVNLSTSCVFISTRPFVKKGSAICHPRSAVKGETKNVLHDDIIQDVSSSSNKIYNPLTKRYIQQTSISKSKRNKWNELMHGTGGYIAHCGELVPIDVEALSLWNEKGIIEESMNSNASSTYKYEMHLNREDYWKIISAPGIEMLDEVEIENGCETEYPIMEQLLFVSKPSQLLTLPGIDTSKPALSIMVSEFLDTDVKGIELMQQSKLQPSPSSQRSRHRSNNRKIKKKKSFVPRPCHRLDYDTSGIIVIGLCIDSLRSVSNLFECRNVKKTYTALVAGYVDKDEGYIDFPIGKKSTEHGYNEFACQFDHENNEDDHKDESASLFVPNSIRPAKTFYKVTQRFSIPVQRGKEKCYAEYSRVELQPYTGRGHQLRLHMEAIGHPILGDQLHGRVIVTPRLCLHSTQLEMIVERVEDNVFRKVRVISTPPF